MVSGVGEAASPGLSPGGHKRAPWSHRWRSPESSKDRDTVSISPVKYNDTSHQVRERQQDEESIQGELRNNVLVFAHRVKIVRTMCSTLERARLTNEATSKAIFYWAMNAVSTRSPGVMGGMLAIEDSVRIGSGWSYVFKSYMSATEGAPS